MNNNIRVGHRVKVNRDDPQWGRIAEYGFVQSITDKISVEIGGNIRATVICETNEVSEDDHIYEDGFEYIKETKDRD